MFLLLAFFLFSSQKCLQDQTPPETPVSSDCGMTENFTSTNTLSNSLTNGANCKQHTCNGTWSEREIVSEILLYDNSYPHSTDLAGQRLIIQDARALANDNVPSTTCANGNNKTPIKIEFSSQGGGGPIRTYITVTYACCNPI